MLHWAVKNRNKPNFQLYPSQNQDKPPPMGTTQVKTLPNKSLIASVAVF